MYFLKIPVYSAIRMILLALPLFFASFCFAVIMLIIYHNEFKRLRENFLTAKCPRITELPLVTQSGQIVNTIEELDMHIELLKGEMEEKEKELEVSKSKIASTEENLKRLTDTTNEVKKFYFKLKTEISKNENECKELHSQIEDCLDRQARLRDEVNQNVKFYTNMLGNMDNDSVTDVAKDYEVVKYI